jgi:hypothetical protein
MEENNIGKEITANYDKIAEKIVKENPGICPELLTIRGYAVLIKEVVDRLEAKHEQVAGESHDTKGRE